jgi:hypothetical protein
MSQVLQKLRGSFENGTVHGEETATISPRIQKKSSLCRDKENQITD